MSTEPYELERFMKLHGFASYEALIERADRDPEWFWPAVMQYHDLQVLPRLRPRARHLEGQRMAAVVHRRHDKSRLQLHGAHDRAFGCRQDRDRVGGRGRRAALLELSRARARRRNAPRPALKQLGLGKGDVVGIYMPFLPETIAAFLAITRIGGIALPMFSGFGSQAVIDRLGDAQAKAVITVDITYRRGNVIQMANVIDEAKPSSSVAAARGGRRPPSRQAGRQAALVARPRRRRGDLSGRSRSRPMRRA